MIVNKEEAISYAKGLLNEVSRSSALTGFERTSGGISQFILREPWNHHDDMELAILLRDHYFLELKEKNPQHYHAIRTLIYGYIQEIQLAIQSGVLLDPISIKPEELPDIEDYKRVLGIHTHIYLQRYDGLNWKTQAILAGTGIMIRYEADLDYLEDVLRVILSPCPQCRDRKKARDLMERVLCLDKIKHKEGVWPDGYKSEINHIRNAFAHGYVDFQNRNNIVMWDLQYDDKIPKDKQWYLRRTKRVFERSMSLNELWQLHEITGTRIIIALQSLLFMMALGGMVTGKDGRFLH